MRNLPPRLLALALLLPACRQQVVVYECPDAHDVGVSAEDGGPSPDAGRAEDAGPRADAGLEVDAGGPADTGVVPDAGTCAPLCLTGITTSAAVVDVRELVTLTPQFDVAPTIAWNASVELAELTFERAPGRPPLDLAHVDLTLSSDGQTVSFMVRDVAPWFMETTFTVTVHVREVGGGAEASATAAVKVRGNVVFSTGGEGHVYAVASDGRPATLNGQFGNGALLEQLVSSPRTLHLGPDGALLVFDDGTSPSRIHRFGLTGKDVLLGNLDYQDGNGDSLFRGEDNTIYSMAELPDGRRVLPEYQFAGVSSEPKSRLMIWDATGAFEREIWAPSPMENWRGAAVTPDGDVLVSDRDLEIVSRYDPTGWLPSGPFLDALPGRPYALLSTPDALYVGGDRYILEVPWSGGRAAVTGLPGPSSAQWRALSAYEGGRLLAVRDTQSATQNIILIDNRQVVRTFRVDGGPVASLYGVLYLK